MLCVNMFWFWFGLLLFLLIFIFFFQRRRCRSFNFGFWLINFNRLLVLIRLLLWFCFYQMDILCVSVCMYCNPLILVIYFPFEFVVPVFTCASGVCVFFLHRIVIFFRVTAVIFFLFFSFIIGAHILITSR